MLSVSNVERLNINVAVRLSFLLLDLVPQLQLAAALAGLLQGGEGELVAAHVLSRHPSPVIVQHLQYRNQLTRRIRNHNEVRYLSVVIFSKND